jgi:hypothetical protein
MTTTHRSLRIAAALAAAFSLPALALDPVTVSPDGGAMFLGAAPWMDPITIEFYSKHPVAPEAKAAVALPKSVIATPTIDTSSKVAVKAAYNTYYNVATPAISWTGSVSGCNAGTISLAFQEWTISRINYFRAMAGVVSNVTLNTAVSAQQQATALIMQANNTLDHFPNSVSTPNCFTSLGATGAGQSNLALATPSLGDSLPIYMSEPGNPSAGHRRWLLSSTAREFGVGQTSTAGAIWVPQLGGGLTGAATAPNGIAWPPRGFVPLALFPNYFVSNQLWSFGYPSANFASASVTVLQNGAPVSGIVKQPDSPGYGDPTIIWAMPDTLTIAKGDVFDVSITGVAGTPSSFSYQVRPFDPADPIGAKSSDLNLDGRSDILWRNAATGQFYRMLVNGFSITGGFTPLADATPAWKSVGDGDFNGDGTSDLVYRNTTTGQVVIITFAAGLPATSGLVYTEPNPAWKIVATPDIDGDGKADLLWWNSTTGQLYAMLMNGFGIAAQGVAYNEPNTAWKVVATGDFSGSGKQNQVLYRNSVTGQVYMLTLGFAGGSTFTRTGQMIYAEPNLAWKIVGSGDFNGDGRTDILYRNDVTGQVYVMLMNGGAVSSAGMVYTEPNTAWKIVAQGDYNGDGKSDLLWRNDTTGQVYMVNMNGLAIASQGMVYTEPNAAWKILGPLEYAQ